MYERVGISLIEVYGRVGKSVILVCKKALGLTDAFHFFLLGGGEGLPQQWINFLFRGGVPNSYTDVGASSYEIKFSSSCVELPALK